MKNYLIVDMVSDYKKFMDYKDIKDLLIEELVRDLKTNIGEITLEQAMLNNVYVLERLAREKETPLSYLEKQLEEYSFKVIDLLQLQRDLEDVKDYFLTDNKGYVGDICETIELINKEVNKK